MGLFKKQKQILEQEKQKLLKIKELLENTNNQDYIDITDVCVMNKKGIYSFVVLKEEKVDVGSYPDQSTKYKSTLTDIFTNQVVYSKLSNERISSYESVYDGDTFLYAFTLDRIYKHYHDLLIYADKMAPRYILLHLYYELNGIDITKPEMQKYLTKNTD